MISVLRRRSARNLTHTEAVSDSISEGMRTGLRRFRLACLGLTLAACGGGGSGGADAPQGTPPPAAPPSISFDPATTSFTKDRAKPFWRDRVALTLHNMTTADLVLSGDYTKRVITHVLLDLQGSPTTVWLDIGARPPGTLFNGVYTDQLTLNACRDQACNQPLKGSPLNITLTYTYTGTDPLTGETGPPSDAQATALQVQSRVALSHDVRDAEYSRDHDRIVMAATYPNNALYIYDVAKGTEIAVPLAKKPTSLSISPDGLKVAVGHDQFVSLVDLTQLGSGTIEPLSVAISTKVFDIALDAQGRVHATPDTNPPNDDPPGSIHTLDIASGSEQRSFVPSVYGDSYARLHPSGNYLFAGDPRNSPASVDMWDITAPAAAYVHRGAFDMAFIGACGDLWFDESGARVFSQCGQVFSTDAPHYTYLPLVGRLELSGPVTTSDAYTIAWMDQFEARNEIALIEANAAWCRLPEMGVPCYHRLGIFDDELLTRQALHALAPIAVNGTLYTQRGLFVFYKSDGTSKFLLSRLDAMDNPQAEYYLSVLE